MKASTVGLCLLPGFALALSLFEGSTESHQDESLKLNSDGYHLLNFEVYVNYDDNLVKRSLHKRDKLVLMGIDNKVVYYMATLFVGSSKEAVVVQLDSGSSDLWVPSPDVQCSLGSQKRTDLEDDWKLHDLAPTTERAGTQPIFPVNVFGRDKDAASSTSNQCLGGGSFDPGKSTTWKLNSTAPPLVVKYVTGNGATGVWGTDSLTFRDTAIPGFSIGSVTLSSTRFGILGVGMETGEHSYENGYSYYNFPQTLVLSGYIHTNVFSLYLGSPDDNASQILFGALDHAKYTGELVSLPIVTSEKTVSYPTYFAVELDSIQLSLQANYWDLADGPWSCVFDCGVAYSYFPADVLASVAYNIGAVKSKADGNYYMKCITDTEYYLSFVFGQQVIDVPLSNLQTPPLKGETLCSLNLLDQVAPVPDIVLEDNFLQYAYVVFDATNMEIALAQAKFTDGSDIEVITSKIPTATGSLQYSNTLQAVSTAAFLYSYLGSIASQDLRSIPTGTPDKFSQPVATYAGYGGGATSNPQATVSKAGVDQSFAGPGNSHNTPAGAESTGPGLTGARTAGASTSIATIEGHPKKNVAANAGVSTVFGILGVILALF